MRKVMLTAGNSLVGMCLVAVLLLACTGIESDNDGDDRRVLGDGSLLYLREEIPVCTAIAESEVDPCAIRGTPNLPSFATVEYTGVPNYWDLYYDPGDLPSVITPHLVIRATFSPDTTRCSLYEREFPAFVPFSSLGTELLMCFVDVRVNDYLIGIGPPTLTLAAYSFVVGEGSVFDSEQYRALTASEYEGREGVMFLAPSPTTVVEVWRMTSFWDVQQTGETVSVVAPYKNYFESWQSRFTAEELALLERPLSEFETVIKEQKLHRWLLAVGHYWL